MKTLNKENLSEELYEAFNNQFVENHSMHKERMESLNNIIKNFGVLKKFEPLEYTYNEYCKNFLECIDRFLDEYPENSFDEPDVSEQEVTNAINEYIDKAPELQKIRDEDKVEDLMREDVHQLIKSKKILSLTNRILHEIGEKIINHLLIKKLPEGTVAPGQTIIEAIQQT